MAIAPVDTTPLFAPLHDELIALLRSLTDEEWRRRTVAGTWQVRDVAAHLLDGDLRYVAAYRDGHAGSTDDPIAGSEDLARLVDGLNATGVQFARRLSTRQLIELLELTGRGVVALVGTLPPRGRALWSVSWAGESTSENWLDIGRQYTERWHHQMQIRDAVGRSLLLDGRWLHPLLDICVHALPVAYAGFSAPVGTVIRFEITGAEPRAWHLVASGGRWVLRQPGRDRPHGTIQIHADAAWRLLFNGLGPDAARGMMRVEGDAALAEPLLHARSVIV